MQLLDRVPLGTDPCNLVGITCGAVDPGGNPLVYLALPDAQKVQFEQDGLGLMVARVVGSIIGSGNFGLPQGCVVACHRVQWSPASP